MNIFTGLLNFLNPHRRAPQGLGVVPKGSVVSLPIGVYAGDKRVAHDKPAKRKRALALAAIDAQIARAKRNKKRYSHLIAKRDELTR